MLGVIVVSLLAVMENGQAGDRIEQMTQGLPPLLQSQFEKQSLDWTVSKTLRLSGTVRIVLHPTGSQKQEHVTAGLSSVHIEVTSFDSEVQAMAGLDRMVQSISGPASGKLQGIGDVCYYWTRQPERGGSVLCLRSGRLVIALLAPTLVEGKAIIAEVLAALAAEAREATR